jgi:ribonuclease BN (tRNA processing enzyme)
MKVTVLGSGTILSMPERRPSSFLLKNEDQLAILDMGPGILHQLAVLNIDYLKPESIFLTHFHLDHCSDVFPFLMSRYLLENKSNSRLKIYGSPGLKQWFNTNASLQGKWLSQNQPQIVEIKDQKIQWTDYQVKTFPTEHTDESIAYRFEGDRSVFFSGDTGFNEEVIQFANDVDLGILECSHPDKEPVAGHLTPKQAGRFAQQASFKELGICHIYPKNDRFDLAELIAKEYDGHIIIFEDLKNLDL